MREEKTHLIDSISPRVPLKVCFDDLPPPTPSQNSHINAIKQTCVLNGLGGFVTYKVRKILLIIEQGLCAIPLHYNSIERGTHTPDAETQLYYFYHTVMKFELNCLLMIFFAIFAPSSTDFP
jgi:hypothetical protein